MELFFTSLEHLFLFFFFFFFFRKKQADNNFADSVVHVLIDINK